MDTKSILQSASRFQDQLIAWYDAQARDLPWRREPSLYKTVISEFMLQQTQVKTALPYFHAWLQRYPNFVALAQASETDVLKSWEGLGYYSRARNLLKLAREVAPLSEASTPRHAKDWIHYPGVGPYAAAAICSIAFGDPSSVVDGNVVRILARLTADQTPYRNSSEAAKSYRRIADALLNRERPGDHNQAMMELGATVCRKRSPQCLLCPVRSHCKGFEEGIAEALPLLAKTQIEIRSEERAWITGTQGVLLRRIPETDSRMSGLHELPRLSELKIPHPKAAPTLEGRRSITRYRITERIYALAEDQAPINLPEHLLWANSEQIPNLAFSGPHRRWITALLKIAPPPISLTKGGER